MTARPGENSKPADPNVPLDEKLFSEYMAFNEEMHKAGVLVAAEGLNPAGKSARVEVKKGKRAVVDGPFTESKELIAGYLIIEVPSREEAIRWMKRWPTLDADGNVTLEIRQIYEAEDFGEEFTPELREREERMRREIEGR